MSYDIYIGEAQLEEDIEELFARFVVNSHSEKDAPDFSSDGDDMTGNSNNRHPGYSQWADFLNRNGLYEVFLGENGLMEEHPGIQRLTEEHLKMFKEALKKREKSDKRPAGLDEAGETKDYDKVRLLWLVWWTEWALKHCKHPCISNS